MEEHIWTSVHRLFPAVQALALPLRAQFEHEARHVAVPAGTVLFDTNSPCRQFLMLLSGSIRVVKAGANGRELQLYRIEAGDSCILTSSCLLGNASYPARGMAETALSAVAVSAALFHVLLEQHPPFRAHIFGLLAARLASLMALVEEVAFRKLDQRLAALLLVKGNPIAVTHQGLADELGSVREIVSRLLKGFEAQGLVALGRQQIRVLDAQGLNALATA